MVVDAGFSRQAAEACHSITILLPFKVPNNNVIWGGGERIPIVITLISRSTTLADLDLPC